MAEYDVERIRLYVDWDNTAQDLLDSSLGELTGHEAEIAAEVICDFRKQFVVDAMRAELDKRHQWTEAISAELENEDVVYIWDAAPELDEWLTSTDDVKQAITDNGEFVDFTDFLNARKQAGTTPEYTTNVFHTLVLYFLENNPKKFEEAKARLRYNAANHSAGNEHAPTHHYFLRAETLLPYASYHVSHEYKIPGIGYKGRRLMREVLFDEDIDQALAAERAKFDPRR